MVTTINILFVLTLGFAIYQTMMFLVEIANSIIDGVKENEGYVDNRHFVLSWLLFLLTLLTKLILKL
tara:strand:+ start:2602 stop:2802 length:201 start_codon:yes stop_codon:yes gene_type:complete